MSGPPQAPSTVARPAAWQDLIAAPQEAPLVVVADTVHREIDGRTYPVLLECKGTIYCTKGPHGRRSLFAEHVVSRLGKLIGAPVAEVALVRLDDDLVSSDRLLCHFRSGLWHGSQWIHGCTDAIGLAYLNQPGNVSRAASMCILSTWLQGNDHQFIYGKAAPNLLHSFDHGEYLGGPVWTVADLEGAERCEVLASAFENADLPTEALVRSGEPLRRVKPQQIADAVAGAPKGWGVSLLERVALAEYIEKRRTSVLEVLDRLASTRAKS